MWFLMSSVLEVFFGVFCTSFWVGFLFHTGSKLCLSHVINGLSIVMLPRFLKVETWTPMLIQSILMYGDVYDKALSKSNRKLANIYNLDLLDDNRHEIHVYTRDGFHIPHHVPDRHTSGGVLLDLTNVPELFLPYPDGLEHHPFADKCTLPSLAFTKTLGNIQANDLIYKIERCLPGNNDPF